MQKNNRFSELDLLRFVAAFSIMLFHYTVIGFPVDDMPTVEFPTIAGISKYGYLGADLFFMISGFVILMTAFKKSAKDFVVSRMVRLYPAFWFCCSLTFLFTLLIGGSRYTVTLKQYLINMTLLSGFTGVPFVDGVYWTLFIEIRFYLLIFLLILFRQIQNAKYFLGAWLALSLLLLKYEIPYVKILFIPEYSAYFIAGATFYLISIERNSMYKALLIGMSLVLSIVHVYSKIGELNDHYQTDYNFVVISIIIGIYFMLFFLIATDRTSFMRSSKYMFIGLMTYPLYLLHENIGFMIFNVMGALFNKYGVLIAVCILMLYTSYLVNRKIEQVYAKDLRKILEQGIDAIGQRFYFK